MRLGFVRLLLSFYWEQGALFFVLGLSAGHLCAKTVGGDFLRLVFVRLLLSFYWEQGALFLCLVFLLGTCALKLWAEC